MSILLNDNLKVGAGKAVDYKYLSPLNLPYTGTSHVNAIIPLQQRHVGLTVNINAGEYWYLNGVTDDDLVPKSTGGGSGEINTGSNVGVGIGAFKTKAGFDLRFRSFSGHSGIILTTGDTLVFRAEVNTDMFNTLTGTTIPLLYLAKSDFEGYSGGTRQYILNEALTGATNLGTGEGIFINKSGRNLEFKSLIAGSNVTLTPTATGITISASGGGGGSGEINTASNIGDGYKIFKNKVGVDLKFRTLSGGTGIHLISGDTLGIHAEVSQANLDFYTGTTAPNTFLTKSDFTIYSGGTRQNILNSAITGATNLGTTGQSVFAQKNGRNLELKRIVGSSNIDVNSTATGITISATGLATTANLSFYTGNTVPNTYYNKAQIGFYTGSSVPNTYYPKTQINFYTGSTVPNLYYTKSQINFYTGSTIPNTYFSKAQIGFYTGTTAPNSFYNKTQINFYTGSTVPNSYYSKSQIGFYTGNSVPNTYYSKTQVNFYTGSTALNTFYTKSQLNFYTGNTAPNTYLTRTAFDGYSGGTRQNILNSAVTGVTNLGTTGDALFTSKSGRNLQFKRLVGGTNINITPSSTGLTISAAGGVGEANTASNIGTGYKLFKRKDVFNLEFRSVSGNSYVQFVSGDTLGVNIIGLLSTSAFNTYSGGTRQNILNSSVTGATNLGTTGQSVFAQKNGRNLELKRMVGSTNISLSSTATGITFTATGLATTANLSFYTGSTAPNTYLTRTAFNTYSGGTRQNILNAALTGGTNLGTTGQAIYTSNAGRNFQLKRMVGSNNISLSSTSTGITFTATGLATTSDVSFYTGSTAPNTYLTRTAFNTYSGGTRQNIFNSAVTGATNLGTTGLSIFAQKNGRNLELKRIVGSTNINTAATSTGITISATGLATTANVSFYTGSTAPNTYYSKSQINFYTGSSAPNTYYSKTQVNFYTGTTAPNTYYSKSQINFYTGNTAPNTYLTRTAFNTYSGGTRQNILNSAVTGATNLGTTGQSVYAQKNGRNLELKRMVGTSNIDVTSSSTGITFTATGLATTANLSFYTGNTAPNTYLTRTAFNTYSGGTRQNILNSAVTGATNLGTTGNALFTSKNGRNLEFKKLVGGTNITLTPTSTGVTISASGSVGEANTASNLGTGWKLFAQKDVVDLQFRTLTGSSNIFFTSGATSIGIHTTGLLTTSAFDAYSGGTRQNILNSAVTGVTNLGTTGDALFTSKSGRNLQFKRLVAGTNVTITPTSTGLTINASGSPGGTVNALNGLRKSGDNIVLGGPLTGDTWVRVTGSTITLYVGNGNPDVGVTGSYFGFDAANSYTAMGYYDDSAGETSEIYITDNTAMYITSNNPNFTGLVYSPDRQSKYVSSTLASAGYVTGRTDGNVVTVTSTPHNETATVGRKLLMVDATSGNKTVNLPTAVNNKATITIKKIDSSINTVTIDANGSQTIDGDLTKTILFKDTSVTLISNNANWYII